MLRELRYTCTSCWRPWGYVTAALAAARALCPFCGQESRCHGT